MRRFARLPSHRVAKWFIAGFWVLVAVLASIPASKLTDAQKNDSVAWLPGNA